MGLREEAVRLLRTKWRFAQPLAEELFLILLQAREVNPGPVSIDLGDGDTVTVPPRQALDPFGQFNLPDISLPGGLTGEGNGGGTNGGNPQFTELDDLPDPRDADQLPTRHERVHSTLTRKTEVFPGEVGEKNGDDGTYTVECWPMGRNGFTTGGQEFSAKSITIEGVEQMQIAEGETIPAGTWAWVWRMSVIKTSVHETVEVGAAVQGERVPSTRTSVSVVHQEHAMIVPVWLR